MTEKVQHSHAAHETQFIKAALPTETVDGN